jgi:polysaccharide export outer membrane protein
MSIYKFFAFFLSLLSVILGADTYGAESLSEYRLGSGDVLRVQVFDEPELSMEIRLSDGGTISYPFLGELRVMGLTISKLENAIAKGLEGDYLIDPKVNVSVLEYRPFYVNGEVENAGGYPFQPGLTLRKAIALAGGFTERASRTKIFAIAEGMTQKANSKQVGMDDVIQPGDIITVEQSFF